MGCGRSRSHARSRTPPTAPHFPINHLAGVSFCESLREECADLWEGLHRHPFLQEMAAKYGLAYAGKAIRCLINYARENADKQRDIFEEVRCLDC